MERQSACGSSTPLTQIPRPLLRSLFDDLVSRELQAYNSNSYARNVREEVAVERPTSKPENAERGALPTMKIVERSEGERGVDDRCGEEQSDDEHANDEHANDEHADDKQADDKQADDKQVDEEQAEDEQAEDEQAEDEQAEDEQAEDEQAEDKQAADEQAENEKAKEEYGENEEVEDEGEVLPDRGLGEDMRLQLAGHPPNDGTNQPSNSTTFGNSVENSGLSDDGDRAADAGTRSFPRRKIASRTPKRPRAESGSDSIFADFVGDKRGSKYYGSAPDGLAVQRRTSSFVHPVAFKAVGCKAGRRPVRCVESTAKLRRRPSNEVPCTTRESVAPERIRKQRNDGRGDVLSECTLPTDKGLAHISGDRTNDDPNQRVSVPAFGISAKSNHMHDNDDDAADADAGLFSCRPKASRSPDRLRAGTKSDSNLVPNASGNPVVASCTRNNRQQLTRPALGNRRRNMDWDVLFPTKIADTSSTVCAPDALASASQKEAVFGKLTNT